VEHFELVQEFGLLLGHHLFVDFTRQNIFEHRNVQVVVRFDVVQLIQDLVNQIITEVSFTRTGLQHLLEFLVLLVVFVHVGDRQSQASD